MPLSPARVKEAVRVTENFLTWLAALGEKLGIL